MKQLDLFASPATTTAEPDFSAERALADRLPKHVHFGASSWTFPGWSGLCYPPKTSEKELLARGLELYSRYPLHRTVGIDRSYYAPISAEDLARYTAQLPPRFPTVMKVWSGITIRADARTGELLPTYLDPQVFEERVLAPVRASFSQHIGALVLEFPPFRGLDRPSPEAFADSLSKFFSRVSREVPYAVEIRNEELLSRPYLDMLAHHKVGHVLNLWEAMPELRTQFKWPGILPTDLVICRLMLRPGTRYAERKATMAPFNRIVDQNDTMREDVTKLVEVTAARKKTLFVVVSNKLEGSSPLTIQALAARLVDAPPRTC